ncbi:MAG TPA: hypothetical protein VF623_06935 [Segetibacter sp.]|jgi:hypothetical protein
MGNLYPRFLISYPDRIYQKDQYLIHTPYPRLLFKVHVITENIKGNVIQTYKLELLDEIDNSKIDFDIAKICNEAENWFLDKIKTGAVVSAIEISKPTMPAATITSTKNWQDIQKEIIAEREEIFRKYGTSDHTILDECMTPEEKLQFKQLEEDLYTFSKIINEKK